jgi:hypothetical protein
VEPRREAGTRDSEIFAVLFVVAIWRTSASWLSLTTARGRRLVGRRDRAIHSPRLAARDACFLVRPAAAGYRPRYVPSLEGVAPAAGQAECSTQRTYAVLPNPSLKRSTNGRPPGPGRWYAVHFHRPGPGVLPLAPA